MPLLGPNEHDIIKLNDEINLMVNQRFVITMTTIAIFGAVWGWIISGILSPTPSKLNPTVFLLTILLNIIMIAMFIAFQMILGSIHMIGYYLRIMNASNWEKDLQSFKAEPSKISGHTESHSIIVSFLGEINLFTPLVLLGVLDFDFRKVFIVYVVLHVITSITYIIIILGNWKYGWLNYGKKPEQRWIELNKQSLP